MGLQAAEAGLKVQLYIYYIYIYLLFLAAVTKCHTVILNTNQK